MLTVTHMGAQLLPATYAVTLHTLPGGRAGLLTYCVTSTLLRLQGCSLTATQVDQARVVPAAGHSTLSRLAVLLLESSTAVPCTLRARKGGLGASLLLPPLPPPELGESLPMLLPPLLLLPPPLLLLPFVETVEEVLVLASLAPVG